MSPPLNLLIATALAAALGKPPPPPPPQTGLDVNKHFRVEAVPPGDPREPAPGQYNVVDNVAYVREIEFSQVKANLKRMRAKKRFGEKY